MNKLYKHIVILTLLFILANIGFAQDPNYKPKQINKCIELLKDGQPIYYINATGGYEEGKKLAKTWADYIMYNMEHHPLDFQDLA